MLSAAEARVASQRNKAQIETTAKRNAAARLREEAKRVAENKARWEASVKKDYETKLTAALKKGLRSFKQTIGSIRDNNLDIPAYLGRCEDTPLHQRIWRGLRARGYKVEVIKTCEYNDGTSMYDDISDTTPWHTYTYTAKVSW